MSRPPAQRLTATRLAGWAWQATAIVLVAALLALLARNGLANLRASGLASGFDFLHRAAGFDIAETSIAYASSDSNGRVFLVGMVNTLRVALYSAVLATLLGVGIGVGLRSRVKGVRGAARVYVELTRNMPLPILLLVLYSLLALAPPPREALELGGLGFVSNRGVYLARIEWRCDQRLVLAGFGAALGLLGLIWRRVADRDLAAWLSLVVAGLCAVALASAVGGWDVPRAQGFGFVGGAVLSPPLVALVGALSLYTAGYIAEVVRGGLAAVGPGQTEAASALGLSPLQTLRCVVLPQALRVAAPPLASQYLNLAKNASLAIVVGYPDLVALFGGTVLNQTGQAIETLGMVLGFYLVLSLAISGLINVWAARQARWAVR